MNRRYEYRMTSILAHAAQLFIVFKGDDQIGHAILDYGLIGVIDERPA